MLARLIITAVTYIICGMAPALVAHYLVRARFIGGAWTGILVGVVGAFTGALIDVFLLSGIPDLLPVANVVDAGPPLIVAILLIVLFALVSRTNE